MFPTTFDVLPDDVLYDILCHSSVRDILALRQVSRKFYHLTHHRSIWVNVYTRCPILLPPGPFSYQSAVDLEQTLKTSYLFEANWTSPHPCPVSKQTFVVPPVSRHNNTMKLVGRYLLIAGLPMLRCYDLESRSKEFAPIAVYDSIELIFDCTIEKYSVVNSDDCQLLCALRNQQGEDEGLAAITLLRLRVSQGSAKFELVKEVLVRLPRKPDFQSFEFTGDFVVMETRWHGPMLLHIPTFQVYDAPPCDFGPDATNISVRHHFTITSKHLLRYSGFDYILEVFPLPCGAVQPNDDDEIPSVHNLTCSHKSNRDKSTSTNILLTERHELHNSNDHTTHYTIITIGRPPGGDRYRLGFSDIFLGSDSVTTTWTDAAEFGGEDIRGEIYLLTGSARAGIARLVVLNCHREAMAFTISEDGDGKRVVRGKPIVVVKKLSELVWQRLDVARGWMCRLVDSGQVEVLSFV